jgi:two-component system nitrate/nitrite response regulator NarL
MAQETNDELSQKKCVLIAHPYVLVREGLCHIIREAGFHICYQAGNVDSLFKAMSEHNPDIIIVDFRITKNAASLVDKIKSKTGAVVAIVATPEEIEQAPEILRAGAKGYLSYSQTAEEFMQSLSLLTKGTVIVSNIAGEKVQSSIHKDKVDAGDITDREREVLILVAKGATNREIAEKLIVSQHTVKIHLHSILNKLNLKNRQQIATYATQRGLVDKDILTEDFSRP